MKFLFPSTHRVIVLLALLLTPPSPGQDYLRFGSLEDPFGYEALKQLIKQKNIQSIDALLGTFSKETRLYGPFLDHFVLMYQSKSLHKADVSPLFPRVISHWGRLILAFTGKPVELGGGEKLFNSLEIIEFVPNSKQLKFRQIQFQNGKSPLFSDSPTRCVGCHGTDSRPIWGSYPLWPGAYGGNNDTLGSDEPKELANWSEFFKTNKRKGRYSYLSFGEELNFDSKNPRRWLLTEKEYAPPCPYLPEPT